MGAMRGGKALAWLLVLPAVMMLLAWDARMRRASRIADLPAIEAISHHLPSNDLALAGGARWLRSPSMEEPGAAFQDGPALPDPDPAGGAMAPPRALWMDERKAR